MLSPYEITGMEIMFYFSSMAGTGFTAGIYIKAIRSTINEALS